MFKGGWESRPNRSCAKPSRAPMGVFARRFLPSSAPNPGPTQPRSSPIAVVNDGAEPLVNVDYVETVTTPIFGRNTLSSGGARARASSGSVQESSTLCLSGSRRCRKRPRFGPHGDRESFLHGADRAVKGMLLEGQSRPKWRLSGFFSADIAGSPMSMESCQRRARIIPARSEKSRDPRVAAALRLQ